MVILEVSIYVNEISKIGNVFENIMYVLRLNFIWEIEKNRKNDINLV